MAKRGRKPKVAVAEAPPKPTTSNVLTFPTETQFRTMCTRIEQSEKRMRAGLGEVAEIVSEAVQNKSVHKGALGIYRRLDKMDSHKRSELLFHLDQYRSWSDWDDAMDLFRTQATEREEATTERRAARAPAAAPSPEAA